MDAISQLQNFTITISKLMATNLESIRGHSLSPEEAKALSQYLLETEAKRKEVEKAKQKPQSSSSTQQGQQRKDIVDLMSTVGTPTPYDSHGFGGDSFASFGGMLNRSNSNPYQPNAVNSTGSGSSSSSSSSSSSAGGSVTSDASYPPTEPTKQQSGVNIEDWKEELNKSINLANEIFFRVAETDALINALPQRFQSEDEQMRQLAALAQVQAEAEQRLDTAEKDAVYCQGLLRKLIREVGNDLVPLQVEAGIEQEMMNMQLENVKKEMRVSGSDHSVPSSAGLTETQSVP